MPGSAASSASSLPIVGDTPELMRPFIPETDDLVAMGYGSTLCLPIVIAGEVRGTVNLLGDAGVLTPATLAEIDSLLPIAALIFTFAGISEMTTATGPRAGRSEISTRETAMRIIKALAAVALGVVLTTTGALAATPKDTLVIADAIDDIITLDPGEVSEVGGVLVSQQIYQPLVTFDINDPTKIVGVLAKSWDRVGRRQDLHLQDEPRREVLVGQSGDRP